jgi:Tfp pilus assembly PilM family ATPase
MTMNTCIELTSSAIRLVREQDQRIVAMDAWPVPSGADPIQALAAAPLPARLGRVTVVMHHDDILVRAMIQPPCDPVRLDRLVRFEVTSMGGGDGEAVAVSWHALKSSFGGDDIRVLALVAKQSLITRLRQALGAHGAKLARLVPPGVALWRSYRIQEPETSGDAVIIDVGGKRTHVAMVAGGELAFIRSQATGMDDLVTAVAERRGVAVSDAATLVQRLGSGAPDDLRELVVKHAGQIAATVTASIRFTKTQLHADSYNPTTVWVAGAGAQVTGFVEALKERSGLQVHLLNPFSGVIAALPSEQLDRLAALPSPWSVALGGVQARTPELDAMSDEHAARLRFWRTDGLLRVAAVVAAALMVAAVFGRETAIANTKASIDVLQGQNNDGLVTAGEAQMKTIEDADKLRAQAAGKLLWLDAQRRPGRIAVEFLAAISAQQTDRCPVTLSSFALSRQHNQIIITIKGSAQSAGERSTDTVLHAFVDGLKQAYPLISNVAVHPVPNGVNSQPFFYDITIPDAAVAPTSL